MTNPVTIIVPVYGDWPSLKDCIDSLLLYTDLKKNMIIFTNDRGPEHALLENNITSAIDGIPNVFYYSNQNNLGFVGNCNAAVDRDTTANDILLLNSDTKVTQNFLKPLQDVFCNDMLVGAISPRSNNATITTIPISAAATKNTTPSQSRRCFEDYALKLPEYMESPVGHGFCLLIRRECIDLYGLFDTIFGKGYGEEVDFCMRIRSHGWKCAISNRSFVYHLEAKSFTSEQKKQLIETNEKVVVERYPSYRNEVRSYRLNAIDKEFQVRFGRMALTCVVILRHLKHTTKNFLHVK